MKSNKWTLLIASVFSAFLFVTIVTAAPTTLMSDLEAKGRQATTTVSVTPEVAKSSAEVQNTVVKDATVVNTSAPTTNNVPSTKPVPVPPKTTSTSKSTPTRSSNALTPNNQPSQSTKASAVIATGKQYIGVKYVYGGTTPSGFDCSGFVQYVFKKNGTSLPRVSRDQFKVGTPVPFSNLQPGDLVFFSLAKNGVVDHEGIYVGNGQFINAASSKGVTIYTLGPYWQSAYVGARRVL